MKIHSKDMTLQNTADIQTLNKWVIKHTKLIDSLKKQLKMVHRNSSEMETAMSKNSERVVLRVNHMDKEIQDRVNNAIDKSIKDYGMRLDEEIIKIKNEFANDEDIENVNEFNIIKKKLKSIESYNKSIEKQNKKLSSKISNSTIKNIVLNIITTSILLLSYHFLLPKFL